MIMKNSHPGSKHTKLVNPQKSNFLENLLFFITSNKPLSAYGLLRHICWNLGPFLAWKSLQITDNVWFSFCHCFLQISSNILMRFTSGDWTGPLKNILRLIPEPSLSRFDLLESLLEIPLIISFCLWTKAITVFATKKKNSFIESTMSFIKSRFPLPNNKTGTPPCLIMELMFFCSQTLPFLHRTYHWSMGSH